MNELIAAVRAHANANWNKDGWDYLVECWDDQDIAAAIGGAKTPRGAIAACKRLVRITDDHRSEMHAMASW